MPKDLGLNELIEAAQKAGGHKTKKAAVTAALEAYVRHHKQQEIISLFGTIDFDPEYDYKAERMRRPPRQRRTPTRNLSK